MLHVPINVDVRQTIFVTERSRTNLVDVAVVWVHERPSGQKEAARGRGSRRDRQTDFQPVHCGERPHADCQTVDCRTCPDRQGALHQAGRKASAGEAVSMEP